MHFCQDEAMALLGILTSYTLLRIWLAHKLDQAWRALRKIL